ncbi:J domain-containing protein [Alginatibacterium sediminis]|uniref:J domain-containing protein n=1 Tax=Alginatibacterium sediminis TaxID=2164068 RepID=A0A420EGQ0_9ALTE|nr:J domain-containing protein [Alginatibacterium sediminis]RKF19840.1 J domain-containing protein [Alginatibacterium sediminis]
MASFSQVLGLKKDISVELARKRYKALANRCHPDKGGSDALMNLVKISYQQVKSGNGDKLAFFSDPNQLGQIEEKQRQLQRGKAQLIRQNQLLKKQATLEIIETKSSNQSSSRFLTLLIAVLLCCITFVASFYALRLQNQNQLILADKNVLQQQLDKQLAVNVQQIAIDDLQQQKIALSDQQSASLEEQIWALKQSLRLSQAREQYAQADQRQQAELLTLLASKSGIIDQFPQLSSYAPISAIPLEPVVPVVENATVEKEETNESITE